MAIAWALVDTWRHPHCTLAAGGALNLLYIWGTIYTKNGSFFLVRVCVYVLCVVWESYGFGVEETLDQGLSKPGL